MCKDVKKLLTLMEMSENVGKRCRYQANAPTYTIVGFRYLPDSLYTYSYAIRNESTGDVTFVSPSMIHIITPV